MSRGGFGRGRPSTRGSFRGGRGTFQQRDYGPPETVHEMGSFVHAAEDEMLCSSLIPDKVPYFNAPVYLHNKSVVGKVDEIMGPINEVYFSVKMTDGLLASSFNPGDKVYIASDKLLPIERFLPKPKAIRAAKRGQRSRGTTRGGRGGFQPRGFQRGGTRGARFNTSRGRGIPRGRGRQP